MRRHDTERAAVPLPPEAAFDIGRHEFAMLADQCTVRSKIQGGVEECAVPRLALIAPHPHDGPRRSCRRAEPLGRRAGYIKRICPEFGVAVEDMRGIRPLEG